MIFFLANMVLVLNLLLVLKNPLCYPAGTEFQRLSIGLGDVVYCTGLVWASASTAQEPTARVGSHCQGARYQ